MCTPKVSPKKLKEARLAKGMSQRTLAKALGFHTRSISNMEQGFRGVSLQTLLRIAELTGYPVSFFLTDPCQEEKP